MRRWQLQEAKNHLSEVVDLALSDGPQIVTRHGHEVVVVMAKSEFDKRRRPRGTRGTLLPFLRALSFRGSGIELDRLPARDRDTEL